MHSATTIVTKSKFLQEPSLTYRSVVHSPGGTENKNGEVERSWIKEGIKFLSYVNVAPEKHNIGIGEYYFCFNSPNAPSGRLGMGPNQNDKGKKRNEMQGALNGIAQYGKVFRHSSSTSLPPAVGVSKRQV
jgi:hypothetical protein